MTPAVSNNSNYIQTRELDMRLKHLFLITTINSSFNKHLNTNTYNI